MNTDSILTVILAGGKGSRLEPLTRDRAKPAVPFGGCYRIIDFTLSNCLNSGLRRIFALTQYKAISLERHINLGWRRFLSAELGQFVDVIPPQQRIDENWYRGTADAVYQNIYTLEREQSELVVILAGDHIYKMNYGPMVDFHRARNADATIAALRVPVADASEFGVMSVDGESRIIGFEEKPPDPKPMVGERDVALASMGIYVFSTRFLFEELCRDATRGDSRHDFGRDIIPSIIDKHRVFAHPFRDENLSEEPYWRDVGTLDAYFEANLDMASARPDLDVYDERWPIRTYHPNLPPAKFVNAGQSGGAADSIVCTGAIVTEAQVSNSIVGTRCRIGEGASLDRSLLFDDVHVGAGAQIRNAIIDKHVKIPPGARIGFDRQRDLGAGWTVSPHGIVVIAKAIDP